MMSMGRPHMVEKESPIERLWRFWRESRAQATVSRNVVAVVLLDILAFIGLVIHFIVEMVRLAVVGLVRLTLKALQYYPRYRTW